VLGYRIRVRRRQQLVQYISEGPCDNRRIVNRQLRLLVSLAMSSAMPLCADDGAASIAAGGVVVLGHETRITMAKEVLRISAFKVTVDYDFRNDSDDDITTEVAFPIPDYNLAIEDIEPARQGFEDFRLWIDGAPAHFQIESRAFHKDKEYTRLLTDLHVDIATFGRATSIVGSPNIERLTAAQRSQLQRAGLIGRNDNDGRWTVRKKYYWRQTFSAHSVVHIRHEYTPVLGSTNSIRYGLGPNADPDMAKELKSFCVDAPLQARLQELVETKGKDAPYSYVDFILTTANTWKTPIEDFTLVVERPHFNDVQSELVSFCWDGPITKTDPDHFYAHATNLIPTRGIRIGFFSVDQRRF
jgi:Domain of unknown function (DUF4424)